MRTFLRTWALDDLLAALPDRLWNWLLRRLGVADGVHSWIEAMCPCGDHGGDE